MHAHTQTEETRFRIGYLLHAWRVQVTTGVAAVAVHFTVEMMVDAAVAVAVAVAEAVVVMVWVVAMRVVVRVAAADVVGSGRAVVVAVLAARGDSDVGGGRGRACTSCEARRCGRVGGGSSAPVPAGGVTAPTGLTRLILSITDIEPPIISSTSLCCIPATSIPFTAVTRSPGTSTSAAIPPIPTFEMTWCPPCSGSISASTNPKLALGDFRVRVTVALSETSWRSAGGRMTDRRKWAATVDARPFTTVLSAGGMGLSTSARSACVGEEECGREGAPGSQDS